MVGIDAPFGRNRIEKGRFPGSSRCMDWFSYVDCMTPPPPTISLKCFFCLLFVGVVVFQVFGFIFLVGISVSCFFILRLFCVLSTVYGFIHGVVGDGDGESGLEGFRYQ